MNAGRQVWRTRVLDFGRDLLFSGLKCDKKPGLHVIWTSWVWIDSRAEEGDTLIYWMLLEKLPCCPNWPSKVDDLGLSYSPLVLMSKLMSKWCGSYMVLWDESDDCQTIQIQTVCARQKCSRCLRGMAMKFNGFAGMVDRRRYQWRRRIITGPHPKTSQWLFF